MSEVSSDNHPVFPRIWFGEEAGPPSLPPDPIQSEPLAALRQSFERLTGWTLRFRETPASQRRRERCALGPDHSAGHLEIDDLSADVGPDRRAIDRRSSQRLADDISLLWEQLRETREQLAACQLELATSVATSLPPREAARLDNLLNQLLASACSLAGFQSASLWLVDDDSLTLRLRRAAGSHFSPADRERHLDQSRADVRAMTGNVIVMPDRTTAEAWQCPVDAASAICLPVSSLSNLYGTLWLARREPGDVPDNVTNVLEIIAGRIAAEIERAALVRKLHAGSGATESAATIPAPRDSSADFPGETVSAPARPPFPGWTISTPSIQTAPVHLAGARWTGFRVTAAESMMILTVHIGPHQYRRRLESIRASLDAFCALGVSPATLIDGLHRLIRQGFDDADDLSACCIEVDPLTGEYRWTSRGREWGQLVGQDPGRSLPQRGGASLLPRQSSLSISIPDAQEIWRPVLILSRLPRD